MTCPDCGYKNENLAVDCAGCGRNLEWAMRDAIPNQPDHRTGPEQPTFIVDQQPAGERTSVGWYLYVWWAVIGTLGLVLGDFLAGSLPYSWRGSDETYFFFFCIPTVLVSPVVGTILGMAIGWPIYRTLRKRVSPYAALGLTTVCIGIVTALLSFAVIAIRLRAMHEARFDNIYDYQ